MNDTALAFLRMRQFLGALALGAALIGLVALTVFLGPAAESSLWPVVTDVRFQVVSRNDERMTLDWWGNKRRRSCVLVSVVALVRRGDVLTASDLSPAGDANDTPLPLVTRPAGFQQFRRMDVIPAGSAIVLQLRHTCHALWPTVTHIAEQALP